LSIAFNVAKGSSADTVTSSSESGRRSGGIGIAEPMRWVVTSGAKLAHVLKEQQTIAIAVAFALGRALMSARPQARIALDNLIPPSSRRR
jgi:hypothetical protein